MVVCQNIPSSHNVPLLIAEQQGKPPTCAVHLQHQLAEVKRRQSSSSCWQFVAVICTACIPKILMKRSPGVHPTFLMHLKRHPTCRWANSLANSQLRKELIPRPTDLHFCKWALEISFFFLQKGERADDDNVERLNEERDMQAFLNLNPSMNLTFHSYSKTCWGQVVSSCMASTPYHGASPQAR